MDLNSRKCRLCLTTTSQFVKIFNEKSNDSSIVLSIKKYFGFEVKQNDSISKHLCTVCWNQIETFHNFSKRVNNIQDELLSGNKTVENTVNDLLVDIDDKNIKVENDTLKRPLGEESSNAPNEEVIVLSKKKLKQQLQSDPANIEYQNKIIRDYMKMECELCCAILDSFQSIQTHFRSEHNTRGYLRCCNRKFTKRCILAEHIQRHINPGLNYRSTDVTAFTKQST